MQADKMREALNVIAEVRDSSRIRQFLETGLASLDAALEVGRPIARDLFALCRPDPQQDVRYGRRPCALRISRKH